MVRAPFPPAVTGLVRTPSWAVPGYNPVPADYDGDSKADPACYRSADGLWAIKCSASGYATTLVTDFGGLDWMAVAADYDGDGKTDPACYRQADGLWISILSADGYAMQALTFGGPNYQPAR